MMSSRAPAKPDAAKEAAILREAVHVFAREGFRGTDVQEIADRAGVGKGTVYRYFGDKQALFWAAVFWVLEQLDAVLAAACTRGPSAMDKLRAASRAYAGFFEENPEYLQMFVLDRAEFRGHAPERHVARHEQMAREFGGIVKQGIESGEIRPSDPRGIVWSLGSTLFGSVVFAAYSQEHRTITDLAEEATEFFLSGIAAERDARGRAR